MWVSTTGEFPLLRYEAQRTELLISDNRMMMIDDDDDDDEIRSIQY